MTWTWWMTLAVILAVLLLIGCIPVGVDAAYGEVGIRLAATIWLLLLQLLPQKPKKTTPALCFSPAAAALFLKKAPFCPIFSAILQKSCLRAVRRLTL